MRALYSLLFYLILPFIFLRLCWRGIKAPGYLLRWNERLGCYHSAPVKNVVWVHAVSVGEAEAVFPLLKQFQKTSPQQNFLVTTTTPTGSARVQAVLGDTVSHVYLPYDTPGAIKRFFEHFQPKLAVIMETELWPNLFAACRIHSVPLFIINARLSAKSMISYKKVTALVRSTLADVNLIATQTGLDAQRFISIGAPIDKVRVMGNIKFDIPPMDALIIQGQSIKSRLFDGRYVWIIASTHKDEERFFLQIVPQLKQIAPEVLLVIVPRHPERFDEVKNLCRSFGLSVVMRTAHQQQISGFNRLQAITEDVYIADTLGELKMLYAAADLAFVGGSLVPAGGHNVLEPAAVGVPVIFGGYMENFTAIAEGLLEAEAAVQCQNTQALVAAFELIYRDAVYRQRLISNASNFVKQNQGTTEEIISLLQQALDAGVERIKTSEFGVH